MQLTDPYPDRDGVWWTAVQDASPKSCIVYGRDGPVPALRRAQSTLLLVAIVDGLAPTRLVRSGRDQSNPLSGRACDATLVYGRHGVGTVAERSAPFMPAGTRPVEQGAPCTSSFLDGRAGNRDHRPFVGVLVRAPKSVL